MSAAEDPDTRGRLAATSAKPSRSSPENLAPDQQRVAEVRPSPTRPPHADDDHDNSTPPGVTRPGIARGAHLPGHAAPPTRRSGTPIGTTAHQKGKKPRTDGLLGMARPGLEPEPNRPAASARVPCVPCVPPQGHGARIWPRSRHHAGTAARSPPRAERRALSSWWQPRVRSARRCAPDGSGGTIGLYRLGARRGLRRQANDGRGGRAPTIRVRGAGSSGTCVVHRLDGGGIWPPAALHISIFGTSSSVGATDDCVRIRTG
jgi:hypothetical protein